MAPTLKVQQVILPNVVDDVNFVQGARRWIGARPATWRSIASATRSTRSRSGRIRTWTSTSAATRRIRSIRSAAPSATRGWGSRSASATPRTRRRRDEQKHEWEEKYHWEEPHLWDYPMLPLEHDRSVVREVPQAGGVRSERREAERRLRDLRAGRLLRLPQDARVREPAEARARSSRRSTRSCRRTG